MAIERTLRAVLACGLIALAWSGVAHADLVAGPPEPCELLKEGAPCHIDGVDPGVCSGKTPGGRKCVPVPDAAGPTVALGDAIDAAPPFVDPAPVDAGDEAAAPVTVPPPPESSSAASPAPPPTRVSGCAGCRVGHLQSDPELWIAAVLLAIGALAWRKR